VHSIYTYHFSTTAIHTGVHSTYTRQVLVEPLQFFIRSCCRWSIHLNQSNVSWFRLESHNKDSVADWFISHKCSSDYPMNPDCHSWHVLSKSTGVYPSSAVKCPCPFHLTSDNPHISTPYRIISSPSTLELFQAAVYCGYSICLV